MPISPKLRSETSGRQPRSSSLPHPPALPDRWTDLLARIPSQQKRWQTGTTFGKHVAPALAWSLPVEINSSVRSGLSDLFTRGALSAAKQEKMRGLALQWLKHPAETDEHAWESLVWLGTLATAALAFSDREQCELLARLNEWSSSAAACDPSHDVLRFLYLAIELPWGLGLLAGDDPALPDWCKLARRSLITFCHSLLDEHFITRGCYLPYLPLVLASWTRSLKLASAFETPFLPDDLQAAPDIVARQALRMLRDDGSTAFNEPGTGSLLAWWPAAAEFVSAETRSLAKALSRESGKSPGKVEGATPAFYHAAGNWASLRRSWSRSDTHVDVSFDGPRLMLELGCGDVLLSGAWDHDLVADGQPIAQTQEWEEVLWYTDDDVAYLELQTWLGEWPLQRQILLPAKGDFVFFSDCVAGERIGDLKFRSLFPLANQIDVLPATETHECWLTNGKSRRLAMPLACPEWRSERADFELTADVSAGGVRQLGYGGGRRSRTLFLPLFLTTAPARRQREPAFTWRKLTVAERLQIQEPDVAFASRMQLESEQWVMYRSLAQRGNRTFLGKNVATEFFFGRFDPAGTYHTIMEVQ